MPDSKRHAQLASPHIRLSGIVDQAMYDNFRQQLEACLATGPIIITITTLGGDPEVAPTMGDDVRLLHEQKGREMIFSARSARSQSIQPERLSCRPSRLIAAT